VPAGWNAAPAPFFPGNLNRRLTCFSTPGFVAVPGFASSAEIAALRARAGELVEAFDPASVSIFSTKDDNQVTGISAPRRRPPRASGGARGRAGIASLAIGTASSAPPNHPLPPPSQAQSKDPYFLESASKIAFFFEVGRAAPLGPVTGTCMPPALELPAKHA
jgi:hypothetical protein